MTVWISYWLFYFLNLAYNFTRYEPHKTLRAIKDRKEGNLHQYCVTCQNLWLASQIRLVNQSKFMLGCALHDMLWGCSYLVILRFRVDLEFSFFLLSCSFFNLLLNLCFFLSLLYGHCNLLLDNAFSSPPPSVR